MVHFGRLCHLVSLKAPGTERMQAELVVTQVAPAYALVELAVLGCLFGACVGLGCRCRIRTCDLLVMSQAR